VSDLLAALSVLFVVGGVFTLVASYARLPTVPFLILAGLVVGLLVEEAQLLELAQYGIALLVFSFGARIEFAAVRPVIGDGELVAVVQVVVVGSLGVGVGVLLGLPAGQALFVGIAAALSSTIVGTALIDSESQLVSGRLAESIQFVHDLLAILFVVWVGIEAVTATAVAAQLGYAVGLVVAGVLFNRLLFDRLTRLTTGSTELLIISVISLLVTFLAGAEFFGVSIAVGAFAAGLAVRPDPAEQMGMLTGLQSITDFFAAVLFVTLGGLVTLPTPMGVAVAVAVGLLTALVKPAVTIALLLFLGYETRSSTQTALGLDQVSEFTLIIAIEALLVGLIFQSVFDAIILAAAATMITSSLSGRYDEAIYRTLTSAGLSQYHHEKVDQRSSVPDELADHLVVIGFGRQGQRLVEACVDRDQPVVVIENDPALLGVLESQCDAYVFGDALEPYTLQKANLPAAELVISTVDSRQLSNRLLAAADGTDLVLRADTTDTARELLAAGALYVNVPDRLAAARLTELIEALMEGEITRQELREWHLTTLSEPQDPRRRRRTVD